MSSDSLREHLVFLLEGEGAHAGFEAAVKDLPPRVRGRKTNGVPHSPWELLEHIRLAQWDILEFSRNEKHVSPEWPSGYWPPSPEPPDDEVWDKSVAAFRADLAAMSALASDESVDLYAKIPWGTGQTILREILLVADHNAYHLGQLVLVRKLLGSWE
jgi:hypothetical protein